VSVGKHIETALADVKTEDRCQCDHDTNQTPDVKKHVERIKAEGGAC
jgi:hypothetical protein